MLSGSSSTDVDNANSLTSPLIMYCCEGLSSFCIFLIWFIFCQIVCDFFMAGVAGTSTPCMYCRCQVRFRNLPVRREVRKLEGASMCTPVLLKNAHKLFKCVSRVNADIDVELRLECGATYSMTRRGPAAGEGTPRRIMSIIRKAKMTLSCRCKLTLSGNTSAMGFSVESANDSVEDCDDDSVKSANDSVEDCDDDSVALANDCHGAKARVEQPAFPAIFTELAKFPVLDWMPETWGSSRICY
jgi:hypothetical protein